MAISTDKTDLTFWAFETPVESLTATVSLSLDSDDESVSSVECSVTWLTATPDGEITADENMSATESDGVYTGNETSSRTGTVTWTTSAGNTATVTITQLGYAIFTAEDESITADSDQQTITVGVPTTTTTADEVSVIYGEFSPNWATYADGSLSLSANANNSESREGTLYLYLTAGSFCGSVVITVTQFAESSSLSVLSSIKVSASGDSFNIQVVTTGGEVVETWTEDIGWVSLTKQTETGNSGNTNFYATVESNTYGDERSAAIVFTGDYGDTATCTIRQYAGTLYVTLSTDSVTMPQGASTKTVTVSAAGTGVSFPLTAETSADWLTAMSSEMVVTLFAVANTGEARTATVTLTSTEGASATLTVTQLAVASRESSRLIPMQCGDDESYILHFYDGAGGYLVLDIYDVSTRKLYQSIEGGEPPCVPFPSGSARELRFAQSFDVMFFAQGQTYPCKLKREEATSGDNEYEFLFEYVDFDVEPLMDWELYSEFNISFFTQDYEDVANEDGTIPVGTVLSDQVSFSFSGDEVTTSFKTSFASSASNKTLTSFSIFMYVTIAYSGLTNLSTISGHCDLTTPAVFAFVPPLPYKVSSKTKVIDAGGNDVTWAVSGSESAGTYIVTATMSEATVHSVTEDSVVLYLGVARIRLTKGTVGESEMSVLLTQVPEGTVTLRSETLYVTIAEGADDTTLISDTAFFEEFTGIGSGLCLTIDGSNTNDSLVVGQQIALKFTNSLYKSVLWDYVNYPVGDEGTSSSPAVEVLDILESKEDSNGNELRPATGGGYGCSSAWMPVRGEVTLKTEGTWSGIIELQERDTEGNVFTIGKITSENGLSNTELTREITEFGHAVRVACTRREVAYQTQASINPNNDFTLRYVITKCDDGCQWTLTSTDIQNVYASVTSKKTLSNGTNVYIVDVLSGANSLFETTSYALGAWSTQNGYPEQISIFQERMVYGCNKQKPTTLWLSKTNDWEDFEAGSDDTSAMNYTMQTDKYDRIRWMLALKTGITLGTDYGEWQFGEANGGVVTIDNARYINTSSIGSATNIPAVVLGQALIMCKTGAQQLHRIDYNTLSEESAGTQLSLLSSHLFDDDPVYDMMVLRSPTNTMYCLHESGKLTSFTYEPEYDVAGWAQHEILDGVLAACVVRRSGVDVIAMIVKNGDDYLLGELNPQSEVYQDDGEDYTAELTPTPLVSAQGGSAYGVKSIFAGVDVYVTDGTQFEVCLPGGSWHHVEVGYDNGNSLTPFDSHKVTVPAAAGWEDEPLIAIRSSYPAPLNIAGVGAAIRRGK